MIIRRLNCFDASKIKKMIAYLGNEDKISQDIIAEAFSFFHSLIPLKFKFRPESFILIDNDEILGLITIIPTSGNPYKIIITRLIFKQNMYEIGKQLVEFVIAKYGAKGAISFNVNIDQSHDELLDLFINGCGFRQCSYENLWKIEDFQPYYKESAEFRYCQNSDAELVAELYNSQIKNLYKPSMERIPLEFKEPVFEGMTYFYKNRYVLEEPVYNKIIAYVSITTSDNFNFIIDLSVNDSYNIDYDTILNFAISEIKRKKSNFCIFVKHRQYTINADNLEKYLHDRNMICVQTQCVLVKDFYKQIRQTENNLQIFQFGEISSV